MDLQKICTMLSLLHITLLVHIIPASVGNLINKSMCRPCKYVEDECVDCSSLNLTYIPQDLNKNITTLNLSRNLLQRLPKGVFKRYSNLLVLDICNNFLTINNMSNTTFEGLTKLKILNISHNDLMPLTTASTPLGLFESMPELEVLKMYGTTGTYNINNGYPDKQLSQLQSLKELWIDGLTGMPFGTEFRNMPNLKILRISGDCIKPSWRSSEFCLIDHIKTGMLDNLIHITHLYIRKCGIKRVDKDVFRGLDMLEYLDVSLNTDLTLKEISIAFGSLQNQTKSLILDGIEPKQPSNYSVIITEDMFRPLQNLSLRELSMVDNNIQLIQYDVFYLLPTSLEIINANHNNFYGGYYIYFIRYLKGLRRLDVSYQALNSLLAIWRQLTEPFNEVTPKVNYYEILNKNGQQKYFRDTFEDVWLVSSSEIKPHISFTAKDEPNTNSDIINDIFTENNTHDIPVNFESFNHTPLIKHKYLQDQLLLKIAAQNTCQINKELYIPPGTVTVYLPPNLEFLDISHCNLYTPIYALIINPNNSLKVLRLRESSLFCWEGPVIGLNKLEVLDLSRNFCSKISKGFFTGFKTLRTLYLNENLLDNVFRQDTDGEIMKPLKLIERLDMSFNRLHAIPKYFLKSQENLIDIKINSNELSEFAMSIEHMRNLRYLDLSRNFINTLSEPIRRDLANIAKGITTGNENLFVNISLNPIDCTCNNIKFLKWVKGHSSTKFPLIVQVSDCLFNGNTWRTIHTQTLLESVIDELENECRSYTELIITLSVCLAVIINVILGVIVHRNRWKLQYWYYVVLDNYKKNLRKHRADYERLDTYLYDVYVASTDNTETMEFCIDKLRPIFKAQNICAFFQAYQNKGHVVKTFGKAINLSRVVIFVFSDEWADDYDMQVAVFMWQCDMVRRNNPRCVFGINLCKHPLIGKHKEEIQYMAVREIIDYPGDSNEEEEKTFWRECITMVSKLKQDQTPMSSVI